MGKFDKVTAQELRERTWEFGDFQEYFQQEGKKWTNSSQFKAVISALAGDYPRECDSGGQCKRCPDESLRGI